MVNTQSKAESRAVRHKRLRSKVVGTTVRPRLAVFRSNRFVYAQIINDETGTTLAAVDSRTQKSGTALERAVIVGTEIAAKAKAADTEMELNMAAYPKGMYYIRLISDKKQAIKKIIKQ